jgi:hypothetical protein
LDERRYGFRKSLISNKGAKINEIENVDGEIK